MTRKSAASLAREMAEILGEQDATISGNAIVLLLASYIQSLGVDQSDFEEGCIAIALDASDLAKLKPSTLQ